MSLDPRPELAAAVQSLLIAQGHAEVAGLLEGSSLELCAHTEQWELGARAVQAQRFAWVVSPQTHAALHQRPAALAWVRDALAAAVRSPETELAELIWCLQLESFGSWGQAYRSAQVWSAPAPTSQAVASAVVELARAYGEPDTAAILARAELEQGDVPGAAELQRWIVRLTPDDFVTVDREPLRRSRVEQLVRAAAVGPQAVVGEVLLAVRR